MVVFIGMKILLLKIEIIILAFGTAMYNYMKNNGNRHPF